MLTNDTGVPVLGLLLTTRLHSWIDTLCFAGCDDIQCRVWEIGDCGVPRYPGTDLGTMIRSGLMAGGTR